jgi:helix-turn-helix protein
MLHSLLQFSPKEMTDTNELTAREIEAISNLFNRFNSYEIQEITGLDVGEVIELNYKLLGM